MKRMSEVFELPIRPQPSDSKYFQHLLFDGSGSDEPIGSFNNCQMAISAMKAINHIDALADALASLLEAYFSNGRVTTDDAACALKALKSYVGDDK